MAGGQDKIYNHGKVIIEKVTGRLFHKEDGYEY
nr:MAG TPA: hypothetical protein [Caudoviricetes sp.]